MMQELPCENPDLPQVGIVRTTPEVSEETLFSLKRCYLGISIDNPVFYGKYLQALLLWSIRNFEQCLVVVGDHLRRFNEQIFNDLKSDATIEAAQAAGDSFMRGASELFQQFPAGKIHLRRWKECLDSNEYNKSKTILDALFTSDSAFRASVEKDAFAFVRRQTNRGQLPVVSMEDATELSCRYLLEEIAVFSALAENGWKVELYPGPELHVLVDIAKGKYTAIPEGLKQRINVELQIDQSKADQP